MTADMALMFPMMELAGYQHVEFMESIRYAYRLHENNDHSIHREEQYAGELVVRAKPPIKTILE